MIRHLVCIFEGTKEKNNASSTRTPTKAQADEQKNDTTPPRNASRSPYQRARPIKTRGPHMFYIRFLRLEQRQTPLFSSERKFFYQNLGNHYEPPAI